MQIGNGYGISVRKLLRGQSLGRSRRRWEDNIKMNFIKMKKVVMVGGGRNRLKPYSVAVSGVENL
jgi:hypothetical protein